MAKKLPALNSPLKTKEKPVRRLKLSIASLSRSSTVGAATMEADALRRRWICLRIMSSPPLSHGAKQTALMPLWKGKLITSSSPAKYRGERASRAMNSHPVAANHRTWR
ncbi:hypothetical protein D3C86_1987210 [compost metagenome]